MEANTYKDVVVPAGCDGGKFTALGGVQTGAAAFGTQALAFGFMVNKNKKCDWWTSR